MFPLVITSVDKILFEGDVASAICPASEGEITLLKGHVHLITALNSGVVRVRENAEAEARIFEINGGILEVSEEGATILI